MAKGITASEMGKRGAATRAQRYTTDQIRKWGKMGGRPAKLSDRERRRLMRLLATGKSQAECAAELRVSTRTIGRAVAKRNKRTDP